MLETFNYLTYEKNIDLFLDAPLSIDITSHCTVIFFSPHIVAGMNLAFYVLLYLQSNKFMVPYLDVPECRCGLLTVFYWLNCAAQKILLDLICTPFTGKHFPDGCICVIAPCFIFSQPCCEECGESVCRQHINIRQSITLLTLHYFDYFSVRKAGVRLHHSPRCYQTSTANPPGPCIILIS